MNLHRLVDSDALDAVSSPDFITSWNQLFSLCPWATSFQKPGFSRVWFNAYSDEYRPLIYFFMDSQGTLTHLLALGISIKNGEVFPCGAHQAEYQCWLASSNDYHEFLSEIFADVRTFSNQKTVRFKYLPPLLTIGLADLGEKIPLIYSSEIRPLACFDTKPLPWDSLRKKSNKSKISRLRQLGDIELQLQNFSEDESGMDQMLSQVFADYDLRQGAVNAVTPFTSDPRKLPFHRELLTFDSGFKLLTMSVGRRVVAAIYGFEAGGKFGIAVFCHAADLARHSPGKLLIGMASELLAAEGFSAIDLTPGGDWKYRFSNRTEDVGDCLFYLSRRSYLASLIQKKLEKFAKEMPSKIGLNFNDVQHWTRKLSMGVKNKKQTWQTTTTTTINKCGEYRIYEHATNLSIVKEQELGINVNASQDLLLFAPYGSLHDSRLFYQSCLQKLERGERVYSYVSGERLAHWGWMIPRKEESFFAGIGKSYSYPQPGCVLYDFHTRPEERGCDLYRSTVTQMLIDANREPSIERVYIAILADNEPARHVIEDLGFVYIDSVYS